MTPAGQSGAGTFVDAFSDAASQYAGARPAYPAALFDAFARAAPNRGLAWDCGTGNGQAAVALAARFDSVVATDASAEQIAHASLHDRVRYTVAPAEDSGLEAGSVSLISVAQAAHWFDLARFYAEVRRVAAPGAVITLYGYDWFYLTPELDALAEQWLLQPVRKHWSPNNRLLWDGYRTIAFPFEEFERLRLAIHLTWTLEDMFAYYQTWSSVRRKLAADGDAFLDDARDAFGQAWGDPGRPRHAVMPLHVRWGRVA
jgi:SAM-dependent methyltransferase